MSVDFAQTRSTLQGTSAGSRPRRLELPSTRFSETGFQEQEKSIVFCRWEHQGRDIYHRRTASLRTTWESDQSYCVHPREFRCPLTTAVQYSTCCSLDRVNCTRRPETINALETVHFHFPAASKSLRRGPSNLDRSRVKLPYGTESNCNITQRMQRLGALLSVVHLMDH